jgi:hypothetical protein
MGAARDPHAPRRLQVASLAGSSTSCFRGEGTLLAKHDNTDLGSEREGRVQYREDRQGPAVQSQRLDAGIESLSACRQPPAARPAPPNRDRRLRERILDLGLKPRSFASRFWISGLGFWIADETLPYVGTTLRGS